MALKYAVDAASLTPVLTSCGRFDLLKQTVASFLEHFETDRIVICEDSERPLETARFAADCPLADVCPNSEKLGQMRSIDALYAKLTTPYVLHLEDDWRFTGGVDLGGVIDFMESRPDVSVVCIGYRFDKRFADKVSKVTHAGIDFLLWDLDAHPKWFSYSFNPSVGRVAFWRQIGPFARFVTEENVSAYCKALGLRIAMVVPGVAHHIGENRHADDPFQPRRAKTLVSRLRRSIAKRLPKPAVAARV
jgi:Glycosyl transferase family 2